MTQQFEGIFAATHTPMRPDGSLDVEAIPFQVEHLVKTKVDGLFVCGTTGEFPSLTIQERRATAEAFVQAASGRIPVIIHVGHDCLTDARTLALHAADIGADAVAAAPPSYFTASDADTVIDCCIEINRGTHDLPFFYYHIPVMTHVQVAASAVLLRAKERFPALAGVKFSSPVIDDFVACLGIAPGRYSLMYGRDEMLLPALAAGGRGAVGSTYNYATPLYQQMWLAQLNGEPETAHVCQSHIVAFVSILHQFGGLRASKAVMNLIGADCGPVRLPLKPLTPEEENALRAELSRIGFFEWRSGVSQA